MEVISEIWQRATTAQPRPVPEAVAVIALLGLLLVLHRRLWPLTRLLVTITHEGAHAVAALLVGRRLSGIRLHSDTSGLTISSGRNRGPGMVAMLAAGYLGPAVAGLAAAGLLAAGYSVGLLWLLVLLLTVMLLAIRNLYGFGLLLVAGAAVGLISWFVAPSWQSAVAYLITWVLLIAAPKPVLELIGQRRRGGARGSDVDQLARLTRIPQTAWAIFFLLCNLAGLALGAVVLVPSLVQLFRPLFGA